MLFIQVESTENQRDQPKKERGLSFFIDNPLFNAISIE
jgi:hypothetical protein